MRFSGLVLGLLIFLLHALSNSSAHGHQGRGRNGNEITTTLEDIASYEKEYASRVLLGAAGKNGLFGGRKMVVYELLRKEIEKEEELNGKKSKISGKDKNGSKESLGGPVGLLNNQNNIKVSEPNTSKSTSPEIAGTRPAHEDIESNVTFEAFDKVAKLMHKDYSGADKPSRMPPVNNHEPTD